MHLANKVILILILIMLQNEICQKLTGQQEDGSFCLLNLSQSHNKNIKSSFSQQSIQPAYLCLICVNYRNIRLARPTFFLYFFAQNSPESVISWFIKKNKKFPLVRD